MNQWRIFFGISGAICVGTGLLFLFVWKSDIKEWDGGGKRVEDMPRKPLKTKNDTKE